MDSTLPSARTHLSAMEGCAPQEVHTHIKRCNFRVPRCRKLSPSSRNLKVSSPTVHAQDRTAPPILAFYPYYYSRSGHSVSVVSALVTGGIECRGTVPAQTVGVLPGTPGSAPQAHRRSALLLGAVVSTLQLESGIGDRQTGDPNRLASQGVQDVLAAEVAVGTTADSEKSSPADCAHGAGEPRPGARSASQPNFR